MKLYTKGVNILSKKRIEKVFKLAFDFLNIKEKAVICLTFVNEKQIQELNKQHRNVDKITDVLSFPLLEIKAGEELSNFKEEFFEEISLGDIVICTKKAREQAKEYNHSYSRELSFLALHGLLHLLGYDHMTPDEEKQMMSVAEQVLSLAGQRRD